MTEVRTDIVALLVDIDFDRSTFPVKLFRTSGGAFTAEEHELVGQARWAEVEAAKRYVQTLMEFAAEGVRDMDRVLEITAPYFARPGVETFGDVEPLLTPDERTELRELFDVYAPDGRLVLGHSP